MASKSQNQTPDLEYFQRFFSKWKEEQSTLLFKLVAVSKASPPHPNGSTLANLVERVTSHYEEYYTVKSKWAQENNILLLLSPYWSTALGSAFLWIGGWRPTTAFHLLYSVSGLKLEAQVTELVNGRETGEMGNLSWVQFSKMDALQRSTISEERTITEEMAKQQEKVADMEMVKLSHEMSESIRMQKACDRLNVDRLDTTLKPLKEGFRRILLDADDLRLRTLKGLIGILSPIQGVHFFIAAAELHLRVHDWGKEKQENQTESKTVSASDHW